MAAVSKIVAVIFFDFFIYFIIVCVYLYMHMYITFFALTLCYILLSFSFYMVFIHVIVHALCIFFVHATNVFVLKVTLSSNFCVASDMYLWLYCCT